MKIPVMVTFHGLEPSEAVEKRVRGLVAKLGKYFERVTSCRVGIACPHQHKHRGRLYSVRIDLTVPEAEIVVNKDHELDHSHEDVYVAIRDSFDAARRRLQDHVRKIRFDIKGHSRMRTGSSAADV